MSGVPGCTTKAVPSVAISPPVVAVRLYVPVVASGAIASVSVAVLLFVTIVLVTLTPDPPKLNVVPAFQCVNCPVTVTVAVAFCIAILGVTIVIFARLGVTEKQQPVSI